MGTSCALAWLKVLSGAPLAWFTSTNSGTVRKAIQDDTHDVHTVIAHAPVESTAAISAPISLVIYAFIVDWRLGLLSIATIPIYGLIYAWMLRGMGDKTAQMDRHLTRVSATMVEFVSGISVVKAFGTVGRSHQRFTQAAEEYSRFYREWCGPMLRGSALGEASVSPIVDPAHLDVRRGGAGGHGRSQPGSGHHLRAYRPGYPGGYRGAGNDGLGLPDCRCCCAAYR